MRTCISGSASLKVIVRISGRCWGGRLLVFFRCLFLLLLLIRIAALEDGRLLEKPVNCVGRLAWPRMLRKAPLWKGWRSSGSCRRENQHTHGL